MDSVQEIIKEHAGKIRDIRASILQKRLKELGITIDIKEELGRRFRNFIMESQGNKDTYYYNDGTRDGLRVVTFERKINSDIDTKGCEVFVNVEETYY